MCDALVHTEKCHHVIAHYANKNLKKECSKLQIESCERADRLNHMSIFIYVSMTTDFRHGEENPPVTCLALEAEHERLCRSDRHHET